MESVNYQAITNTVQSFFMALDGRAWEEAKALMASPFHLDYSSFGAGPPSDIPPKDVLDGWKGMLLGLDQTHHQLGPLLIELGSKDGLEVDTTNKSRTATVKSCVSGLHFLEDASPSPMWNVYGNYTIQLKENQGVEEGASPWIITSLTFHFKFKTGNMDIPKLAQERASKK